MSILNDSCDYCGRQGSTDSWLVFYTGDERISQFWDGECRGGSRDYFGDLSNEVLKYNIEQSEAVLKEDPIRFREPYDPPMVHQKKVWLVEEVFRAKQELVYRIEEA